MAVNQEIMVFTYLYQSSTFLLIVFMLFVFVNKTKRFDYSLDNLAKDIFHTHSLSLSNRNPNQYSFKIRGVVFF